MKKIMFWILTSALLVGFVFIFSLLYSDMSTSKTFTKGLCRNENQLLMGGKPFNIKAINFDNLVWYTSSEGEAVYPMHHDDSDLDRVQAMGFNTIRFALRWDSLFTADLKKKDDGWQWLEHNVEAAKERGLYLIVDLHVQEGGFGSEEWLIWDDEDIQKRFVQMWDTLSEFCSDKSSVIAYDLMNEPVLPKGDESQSKERYRKLMDQTILKIRQNGDDKLIMVEAAVGIDGAADSFLKPVWVKVSDENVCYSFHYYEPFSLTHPTGDNSNVQYPSSDFDKTDLINTLNAYIEEPFLKNYPLFLGEFGSSGWTGDTGSALWIDDVYAFAEKEGIHTAYYTYRSFLSPPPNNFGISTMNDDGSGAMAETVNKELEKVLIENLK